MTTTQQTTERKVGRSAADRANLTPPVPKGERVHTTLGDYGDKLPIGILDSDGRLHKDIVTKQWKTRDERELGRKIAPDAGMAEHVPLIVANMCSRIGPHDMDAKDDATKSVILSTMYMADVFYVYLLLRTKTMGHKLKLTIGCPRPQCNVRYPYTGDLRTTEVVAVDDIDLILRRYDLEEPFEIRKKRVTHMTLSYPKWSVMERSRHNSNEAEIKAMVLQDSIVGLNDDQEPVSLTLNELDEMSRPDFEGIQETINENYLGPKMGIEGSCTPSVCTKYKRGGQEFKMPIDWAYKSFFGASSR